MVVKVCTTRYRSFFFFFQIEAKGVLIELVMIFDSIFILHICTCA